MFSSQNGDERGSYAHLEQSLVAPEGTLPTTQATVSFVIHFTRKNTQGREPNLLRDFDWMKEETMVVFSLD